MYFIIVSLFCITTGSNSCLGLSYHLSPILYYPLVLLIYDSKLYFVILLPTLRLLRRGRAQENQ
jgi:hypothetical protein